MKWSDAKISAPDAQIYKAARTTWDTIAKPLGGLGTLEDVISSICAMRATLSPSIADKRVVVFCADNGVVSEGVSQTDASVTHVVAQNLCDGNTSVCKMAQVVHALVVSVDIGMNTPVDDPRMIDARVAAGTNNIRRGAAMAREQVSCALQAGFDIACEQVQNGCELLAMGEMGIGNTTTASAIVSALLGLDPYQVVGPGAGLSQIAQEHKAEVVTDALRVNAPDAHDALDVLAKVGGFDIAGMVGLALGAAACSVPCMVDGAVSMAAALVAVRLEPLARGYLIASHVSSEPLTRYVVDALSFNPPISAGMHVGEGSGAVACMPLLDMALAVFLEMGSFSDYEITPYVRYDTQGSRDDFAASGTPSSQSAQNFQEAKSPTNAHNAQVVPDRLNAPDNTQDSLSTFGVCNVSSRGMYGGDAK